MIDYAVRFLRAHHPCGRRTRTAAPSRRCVLFPLPGHDRIAEDRHRARDATQFQTDENARQGLQGGRAAGEEPLVVVRRITSLAQDSRAALTGDGGAVQIVGPMCGLDVSHQNILQSRRGFPKRRSFDLHATRREEAYLEAGICGAHNTVCCSLRSVKPRVVVHRPCGDAVRCRRASISRLHLE